MARVTLKDLALAAGVSTTTVSHALHGTRHVSPRTREAIQALALRLGYRPDPVARTLQGQDSLLIGHIVGALIGNPFFAQVARGADRRAQEAGFTTVLACTEHHEEAEARTVDVLLQKRVDGIIFNTPVAAANVARVVAAGVAAVMIERPLAVPGAHSVVVDHRRGIYDLTRLLIDQGHRRIGYLGGDFAFVGSDHVERPRVRGFRSAMREARLSVPAGHLILVPYGIDSARAATHALLNSLPPTALVIGSDQLAVGALQSLYERGVRVPDDISVVSYDDTLGEYMAPPLTETEPPTDEMGRQAVDLIVEHCRGLARDRPADRGRRVLLQPRIHIRASTRALDTRALQVVAP